MNFLNYAATNPSRRWILTLSLKCELCLTTYSQRVEKQQQKKKKPNKNQLYSEKQMLSQSNDQCQHDQW